MANLFNPTFLEVNGIGRIGSEVKLEEKTSGDRSMSIGKFSIAADRDQTKAQRESNQEKKTDWVNCVIFGGAAKLFAQYAEKGRLVFIKGRLEINKWEDQNTGEKKSSPIIVIDDIRFVGSSRKSNAEGNQGFQGDEPFNGGFGSEISFPEDDFGGEDLPF